LRPERLPLDKAAMDRLAREFPAGFYLDVNPKHLVVYDTSHRYVDTRVWLLERAHTQFTKAMREADLPVLPLSERLVVVLFDEHGSYLDYARRTDPGAKEWTGGYYSGATNRIVLFNSDTAPAAGEFVQAVETARNEVQRLRGEAAADRRQAGRLAAAEAQLRQARARLAAVVTATNRRQTLHEAVHQLAYNTGLQRRDLRYPLWFTEGLATSFESHRPANPFGPAHDNIPRRQHFDQAIRRGQAIPLDQFVTLDAPSDDDDNRRRVEYAQAWALFQYLYNHRPRQLAAYVRAMNAAPAGIHNDARQLADFKQHFGDLTQLEAAYQSDIRRRSR
jgi:hypothetical protein